MYKTKSKIFAGVITAIFWSYLFCSIPASATEYISAHTAYLINYVGYVDSGEEAAQGSARSFCGNCTGSYTGLIWKNDRWYWQGTMTYEVNGSSYTQPIGASIDLRCPVGWSAEWDPSRWPARCYRNERPEPPCEECDKRKAGRVGNPILVNGGIKIQSEVDYENASGTLRLIRTYRSDDGVWRHNYEIFGIDFNNIVVKTSPNFACLRVWELEIGKDYCYPYAGKGTPKNFGIRRGAGRLTHFGNDVDYSPSKDVNDRVQQVVDSNGTIIGWQVANASNGSTEFFGPDGRLQRIANRNGLITTFTYSDDRTPSEIAPGAGYLLKVQDPFGRALQFTYTSKGSMASMSDPAGNVTAYEYDGSLNLSKVTYPDGKSRTYIYDEPALVSNLTNAHLLTGIVDENGKRYATFYYDSQRRATSTEHAGSIEKYTLAYPYQNVAWVIDPLNTSYNYNYSNILGVLRQTSVSRQSANNPSLLASESTEYDANGNIARYTDYDGSVTAYTFDLSTNLETQRIEASGTSVARTIQTEWHPTFRLPARVSEPLRRTTYTYDAAGNVLTKTIQATTDTNGAAGFNAALSGTPQVWTYTYDSFGHLVTAKGPRSGIDATSTFTYDAEGNLSTQTNAAGHVTTYSNYDPNGRVGRVTDPNGLVTELSYTPRGWLAAITVGGETTSYDYDGAGQVIQITLPDGSSIYNTYDDAHRLTSVRDTLGNSITYTLDPMGNRTSEQSKDANGALTRQITRAYDGLNRMKQITGALQ